MSTDFPDEEDSTGSDMSEYDWSEGSDDELGSPTKMPYRAKKSSLRQPARGAKATNGRQAQTKSKSVRFSGPDVSAEESTPSPVTQKPSCPIAEPEGLECPSPGKAPVVPPRPSKLMSSPARPGKPPPPRPTSNPPPVPARPSANASKSPARPLSKPSGMVKPSAPPPPPPPAAGSGGKRDKKLEALMDAMDRELAATDVGKSFEREPKRVRGFMFF